MTLTDDNQNVNMTKLITVDDKITLVQPEGNLFTNLQIEKKTIS